MEIVRLARAVGPVAALALAALITWAWDDGGTDAGSWGLVGLGLVLLLAVAIFAYPPRSLGGPAAERRLRVLLVGSLAGFVAWNFASILWADFREDALFGSDKTLLYAVLFTLFALWRWQANATLAILGVFALGVGAVGAVVLV